MSDKEPTRQDQTNENSVAEYGVGDASLRAAGGEKGVRHLVDTFYDRMGRDPRFARIYALHPDDRETSRDKLARFLVGWLGGPRRYQERYGSLNIPSAHSHLPIKQEDGEAWLLCMAESVDEQPFDNAFKEYLLRALSIPAGAIVKRCAQSQ